MKKRNITIIALAAGICTLTTAVLANYSTANGYDILKKSIKNLLGTENYTLAYSGNVYSDNTKIFGGEMLEKYDKASQTCYRKEYSQLEGEDDYSSEIYYIGGARRYKVQEGKLYRAESEAENVKGILDGFAPNDDLTEKYIKFGELLSDAVVGDLKNNFACTASDNNGSTYEINLSSIQVPEIVNAGLSVIFGQINHLSSNKEDGSALREDVFRRLGSEPTVKSATLKFSVDKDGRLIEAEPKGVIEGNGHSVTVDTKFFLSDLGTTVPMTLTQEQMNSAPPLSDKKRS